MWESACNMAVTYAQGPRMQSVIEHTTMSSLNHGATMTNDVIRSLATEVSDVTSSDIARNFAIGECPWQPKLFVNKINR